MRKRITTVVLFLILLSIFPGVTACVKADKKEDSNGIPKITVEKCENGEDTAVSLFDAFLDYYEGSPVNSELKIDDYKISNLVVLEETSDELYFYCDYCIKSQTKAWIVGNGVMGDEGWINNKVVFVECKIKENKVTLKKLSNSPKHGTNMDLINNK